MLNRAPGLATSLHRVRDPLAVLIGSLLRFPRTPERERARFEMAGTIAAHVPIWELSAEPSVPPGALAGLLRADAGRSPRSTGAEPRGSGVRGGMRRAGCAWECGAAVG